MGQPARKECTKCGIPKLLTAIDALGICIGGCGGKVRSLQSVDKKEPQQSDLEYCVKAARNFLKKTNLEKLMPAGGGLADVVIDAFDLAVAHVGKPQPSTATEMASMQELNSLRAMKMQLTEKFRFIHLGFKDEMNLPSGEVTFVEMLDAITKHLQKPIETELHKSLFYLYETYGSQLPMPINLKEFAPNLNIDAKAIYIVSRLSAYFADLKEAPVHEPKSDPELARLTIESRQHLAKQSIEEPKPSPTISREYVEKSLAEIATAVKGIREDESYVHSAVDLLIKVTGELKDGINTQANAKAATTPIVDYTDKDELVIALSCEVKVEQAKNEVLREMLALVLKK